MSSFIRDSGLTAISNIPIFGEDWRQAKLRLVSSQKTATDLWMCDCLLA